MELSPPSPFPPFPLPPVHLPCRDNDSNIAVAFGIPAALVGLLVPAAGRAFQSGSASLPTPQNADNGVLRSRGWQGGKWLVFNPWQAAPRAGAGVVRGMRAELSACPARWSCQLPLRPSAQGAFIPLDGNRRSGRMRLCVGSDPPAGMVRGLNLRAASEGRRDPGLGAALSPPRALPGLGAMEILSPGPCCRMSHRAGIRACNGPVSIPPFRDPSVADGSGPCVPPGRDSER